MYNLSVVADRHSQTLVQRDYVFDPVVSIPTGVHPERVAELLIEGVSGSL